MIHHHGKQMIIAIALGQQSRGAHFLSHDLTTLALCWFGALFLFLLTRHWRKPPADTIQRGDQLEPDSRQ